MKQILIIDNYDSFTYNLVQLVRESTEYPVTVWRNDCFEMDDVAEFDQIILSPGPGLPNEAGLMPELVKRYSKDKIILGICLGHQCIAEIFGAKLSNLDKVVHGKEYKSTILDTDNYLFQGLEKEVPSGRYHSWVVSKEDFPSELTITAEDQWGNIMGIKHNDLNVQGLQFHPESVLTPQGDQILKNWLQQ